MLPARCDDGQASPCRHTDHAHPRPAGDTAFALSPRSVDLKVATQTTFSETFVVAAAIALMAVLLSTKLGSLIGLWALELAMDST
jgi:hypothetical protein